MSRLLINEYLADIDRLRKLTGRPTESIVSEAFKDLLKRWSRGQGLEFVAQYPAETGMKARVVPDGTILHAIRVPLGHWEAKDTDDDLDAEIEKKRRKGYPTDNIVFEDSRTAVLIQDGREIARCGMSDVDELDRLLGRFFAWERPEIAEFRKAVAQFRADLPHVLDALRAKIDDAYAGNAAFAAIAADFHHWNASDRNHRCNLGAPARNCCLPSGDGAAAVFSREEVRHLTKIYVPNCYFRSAVEGNEDIEPTVTARTGRLDENIIARADVL